MKLSKRVQSLQPSITLGITAKANAMKVRGLDVIGFGAGEPDFDTPQQIKDAAVRALEKGMTKYTPSAGMLELRKELVRKFKKDNGLDYEPGQIVVAAGAKYAIFEAICALIDPGDEVVIPSPYWVSYPEMVSFAGGVSRFVDTSSDGFLLTPQALEAAITPRTRIVILNYPSNPTGMSYSRPQLEALVDVIVKNNLICLSDEIYEKLLYDGLSHVSIASLSDEIKQRTIVVNGASKAFSMTGWRIGYMAGPAEIMKAVNMIQDHSTSCPASIAQAATLEAVRLDNEDDPVFRGVMDKMINAFVERRDVMVKMANAIPGVSCLKPQGAFYCFFDVRELLGRSYEGTLINDSLKLCDVLLEKENVAIVPGVAFGADRYVRLSYALLQENLRKGLDRFAAFVSKLK
jgi:aspartate aminotransferase